MAKKLFVREITYRAYVYAEDGFEASDYDIEIVSDSLTPSESLTELVDPKRPNPLRWDLDCCVYHSGSGDITLRELLPTA